MSERKREPQKKEKAYVYHIPSQDHPAVVYRPKQKSSSPVAEQEPVSDIEVVYIEHDQRDGVVPLEAVREPPGDGADHAARAEEGPEPAQDAHVAVLVALVGLGIARRRPHELDAEEPVLDGRQVGVRLDQHDVLDVHGVRGLGPEAEDDEPVDDGRDGEGEVVVLEPLWAEPQEEDARDRGDEDAQGDGRVVEEAW